MSKGEIKNPFSGPSSDKRLECLTSLDREIGEIKQFDNTIIGWEISVRTSCRPVLMIQVFVHYAIVRLIFMRKRYFKLRLI